LHNDLYFADRLTQWMIEKSGLDVEVGYLHFSSTSLHCFVNDRYTLKQLTKTMKKSIGLHLKECQFNVWIYCHQPAGRFK